VAGDQTRSAAPLADRGVLPQGQAVISYLLSAEGEDTVFRRDLSYEMPNEWLALLDVLVLRRRMDRESRIALQRLKSVLEGLPRKERSLSRSSVRLSRSDSAAPP
jgi:hypothetical protein